MIQLRVKELLLQKGIKPTAYSLLKLGIPFSTAKQIIEGRAKVIKLQYIEKLCLALHCTPKEILGVYNTEDAPILPNTPLHSWVGHTLPFPLEQFKDLSPEQMAKASDFMQELVNKEI